ncbi:MAG: helix-turn-helix domain-containing protein [Kordiimonadaceae bacterium]|nr:helix-turn-helix domain-containing protein [Kordiimonadaceae bacterium]
MKRAYSSLDEEQSLDALAARSGWSKFHLHREFCRHMGESPKKHILRLRLDRIAAELICEHSDHPQKSLLTLASENGFNSNEVFTRAFRRAYGCSPSQYRTNALNRAEELGSATHQHIVSTAGPCLKLHHSQTPEPYSAHSRSNPMSQLSITRKEIEAQPILFIRRRVEVSKIQPLFAECFSKIFGHCMKNGLAMAGQPTARYVAPGTGLWTIDCAIPLQQPAARDGDIEAGFLQAGPVAFAVHHGAYDQLPATNASIERWIEDNGHQKAGPPWETYVTDPSEHPDVKDWRTEVYWPIAE